MKIEEKIVRFFVALSDVYREEENRQLCTLEKLGIDLDDVTGDFTAMLIAMKHMYIRITGDDTSDLIDFTHILNKLAIQYAMEAGNE